VGLIVIPGRREAANPESMTTEKKLISVFMDSGLACCARAPE